MRHRTRSLALALLSAAIVSGALSERLDAASVPPVSPPVVPKKPPKVKPPAAAARDCANPTDRDRDQDGHPVMECGGDDCDDDDAFRFPGAGRERCQGELADGRKAANHDEDCNPCTVSGSGADGDRDLDGRIAASCSNPFLGAVAPNGCDERELRIDGTDKRVRGADCDDLNEAVQPGTQICASADTVSLCMPTGGPKMIPTSATGAVPKPKMDTKTGFATMACPSNSTCFSQPDGSGMCMK